VVAYFKFKKKKKKKKKKKRKRKKGGTRGYLALANKPRNAPD
jgi:hypothetical protein